MNSVIKHILILTPGFPADENDSTCIPALQIYAERLAKTNPGKISVLNLYYPNKKAMYKWNDIEVISLALSNKRRNKLTSILLTWRHLKMLHEKTPINAIHSFWLGECAFLGHYFSKKNGINHIVTLMGQDAKKGNPYAKILPLKEMKLVTLSPFHHDTFLRNFKVNSHIIPWGVNAKSSREQINKTIDIIGIGSLIPLKDYRTFIEIIETLKPNYPKIKVVLIGDGVEKNTLIEIINKAQLQKNIKLLGELPYKKTQQYLSQSKILLHTSRYESFGMVFAEALAYNVSIVSRPVGIANKSDYWGLGKSKNELVKLCIKLLSMETPIQSKVYDVKNTVLSYLNLYNA